MASGNRTLCTPPPPSNPITGADLHPGAREPSGEVRALRAFLVRFCLGKISMVEVEKEWRAAVAAVRHAGVAVSHLDSHQHVHLLQGISSRVAAPLSRESGLTPRAMDGPYDGSGFRERINGSLHAPATRIAVARSDRALTPARGFGSALLGSEELRAALRIAGIETVGSRPGRGQENRPTPAVRRRQG